MSDTLPLKDFIESTLTSICEAIDSSREKHPYIAPQHSFSPDDGKTTLIEFDVAVAVTSNTANSSKTGGKVEGNLGVGVLGIGAKLNGEIQSEDETSNEKKFSHVSRIKFNIPVHFRLDLEKYDEHERKKSAPRPKVPSGRGTF